MRESLFLATSEPFGSLIVAVYVFRPEQIGTDRPSGIAPLVSLRLLQCHGVFSFFSLVGRL